MEKIQTNNIWSKIKDIKEIKNKINEQQNELNKLQNSYLVDICKMYGFSECNEWNVFNFIQDAIQTYEGNFDYNKTVLINCFTSTTPGAKYYHDLILFHSIVKNNYQSIDVDDFKKYFDEKLFYKCLSDLYFDRDDGYGKSSIDLTKTTTLQNLDIYTYFQNTPLQINLFTFLEEQRTPNYLVRNDNTVLIKLLYIAKMFEALKFSIVVVCSKFTNDTNNKPYYLNTPFEFNMFFDMYVIKKHNFVIGDIINIYLIAEFHCL